QLRRPRTSGDVELVVAPIQELAEHPHPPGCALFTLSPSSRLHAQYVRLLNRAALVLTASHASADHLRTAGVTVPVVVLPMGHDPLVYYPNRLRPDICTFGSAGTEIGNGNRKEIRRTIELFQQAFPDQVDVRLRVKLTPRIDITEPDDPRIE